MKKLLLLLLLSSAALGQTNRFDSQALGPKGPLPNVIVSVCAGTASGIPCSPQIQTYTDATLATQCTIGSPVTPAGSSICSGTSDALGNYGFWLPAGVYKYSLTGPGITGKTYDLILPTSSGVTACSSSNIQNCINAACPGTVPGIAWLPLGSSTGVAPFTIPNNCTVKCPSPWGCKITLANSSNANFITQKTIPASNIVLEDTIIDGNQTNQSGTSSCIYMQSVNGVHLNHNTVQNCRTHAVFVDGCQTYVGATCTVPAASQNVWVENNLISSPLNGHGVEMGNGPSPSNTVVNNLHIRGNNILHSTSSLVNGIFILGAASVGTCGTGQGDITNNIINGATDTGIEVGQGTCQITVTGNSVGLGALNGTTGIAVRSAQEIAVSNNQVHGNGTNTTQFCYFFWNNAGNDDLRFQTVTASNNVGKGCTATSSFDVAVNLGTAGARGIGDHLKLAGFVTDGGPAAYNYNGIPSNFDRTGNDDGNVATTETKPTRTTQDNAGDGFYPYTASLFQGSSPLFIEMRASNVALPGGLYRFSISSNQWILQHNTAAAGDFSSNSTDISDDGSGNISIPQGGLSLIGLSGLTINAGLGATWGEGSAVSAVAAKDVCYGDSTAHALKCAYNNGSFFNQTQTIGSGTVATAGTAVTNGTCQAQTGITVTGATTTDVAYCSLNAAAPATWQTGIFLAVPEVTSNTVTVRLCNGTAASITPAAATVRCTVTR